MIGSLRVPLLGALLLLGNLAVGPCARAPEAPEAALASEAVLPELGRSVAFEPDVRPVAHAVGLERLENCCSYFPR